MAVSADGRVTWPVPADYAETHAIAIIAIQDGAGQETLHGFGVKIPGNVARRDPQEMFKMDRFFGDDKNADERLRNEARLGASLCRQERSPSPTHLGRSSRSRSRSRPSTRIQKSSGFRARSRRLLSAAAVATWSCIWPRRIN